MRLHHALAPLVLVIALGALFFRAGNLDHRPMHGDESINADKFREIYEGRTYRYDPEQYHGPTLPFLTIPAAFFAPQANWQGLDESDYRWVAVMAGSCLVLATLLLRGGMSKGGIVLAALFTAISPPFVFYSRYYIHEMLLVLFTLTAIGSGWKYVRRPRLRWALTAGASLGLMQATKETSVIAYGAMAGGLALLWGWQRMMGSGGESGVRVGEEPAVEEPRAIKRRRFPKHHIAGFLTGFVVVCIGFFSSFGSNWSGVWDAVRAYTHYLNRAGESIHVHSWDYYLNILIYTHKRAGPAWSEAMIMLLAIIGTGMALAPGMSGVVLKWAPNGLRKLHARCAQTKIHRFVGRILADVRHLGSHRPPIAMEHLPLARFLVFYTVLMTALYSAIPYKTPWCLLGFFHGWILLAAIGGMGLFRCLRPGPVRIFTIVLLTLCTWNLYTQSATTISERFDSDLRNPYVYAHPTRDVLRVAKRINELATLHADDRRMVVVQVIDNPWPLPWYLRRMEQVAWFEKPGNLPADYGAPVFIVEEEMVEALVERLPRMKDYQTFPTPWGLRPDVKVRMIVEKRLYEEWEKSVESATTQPE